MAAAANDWSQVAALITKKYHKTLHKAATCNFLLKEKHCKELWEKINQERSKRASDRGGGGGGGAPAAEPGVEKADDKIEGSAKKRRRLEEESGEHGPVAVRTGRNPSYEFVADHCLLDKDTVLENTKKNAETLADGAATVAATACRDPAAVAQKGRTISFGDGGGGGGVSGGRGGGAAAGKPSLAPSSSRPTPTASKAAATPATPAVSSIAPDRPAAASGKWSEVAAAFATVNGYTLSKDEKKEQRAAGTYIDGLMYGEVDPESFATEILGKLALLKAGESFVDVGSGVGKAVVAAAVSVPGLKEALGLEILASLHNAAEAVVGKLGRGSSGGGASTCSPDAATAGIRDTVELRCGDAFATASDWAPSCDVCFCTTTCFSDDLHQKLLQVINTLFAEGTRLIVTTSDLKSPRLKLVSKPAKHSYGAKGGRLKFFVYTVVGDKM